MREKSDSLLEEPTESMNTRDDKYSFPARTPARCHQGRVLLFLTEANICVWFEVGVAKNINVRKLKVGIVTFITINQVLVVAEQR